MAASVKHLEPASLPTEAEYEAVYRAVNDSFSEVECLSWRLAAILKPWNGRGEAPERVPTWQMSAPCGRSPTP